MAKFIFITSDSLAQLDVVEGNDVLDAIQYANFPHLPIRIVGVQIMGEAWVLDENDPQVVRKAHPQAPGG